MNRTRIRLWKIAYRASIATFLVFVLRSPMAADIPGYLALFLWFVAWTAFISSAVLAMVMTGSRAARYVPLAYKRRVLCDALNMHRGHVETVGLYSYVRCHRCGGLHHPMPRFYAEARFGDRYEPP